MNLIFIYLVLATNIILFLISNFSNKKYITKVLNKFIFLQFIIIILFLISHYYPKYFTIENYNINIDLENFKSLENFKNFLQKNFY
nr:hypothetical protein [uncultured Cetobacterium sp.]